MNNNQRENEQLYKHIRHIYELFNDVKTNPNKYKKITNDEKLVIIQDIAADHIDMIYELYTPEDKQRAEDAVNVILYDIAKYNFLPESIIEKFQPGGSSNKYAPYPMAQPPKKPGFFSRLFGKRVSGGKHHKRHHTKKRRSSSIKRKHRNISSRVKK